MDVSDNTFDVSYGTGADPASSIAASLKTGYSSAAWNGLGIDSSTVANVNAAHSNSHLFAVAYADLGRSGGGERTNFPATNTVVVKLQLVGDANMDGVVNFTDFQLFAANFNGSNTSWDQGNFNYGATTNFTDFQLLAANFKAVCDVG